MEKKNYTDGNQNPKQTKPMKLAAPICVCGTPSVSCLWVPAEPQAGVNRARVPCPDTPSPSGLTSWTMLTKALPTQITPTAGF